MSRILLSPPDVTEIERNLLLAAFDASWIAPAGPDLDAFEQGVAAAVGVRRGVALASGTAALQLSLLEFGVGPGDEVIVPTLTFVATANAVVHLGARPRFVDSETRSWNLDPDLLAEELASCARRGRLPAAVVSVDLYGQCADHAPIAALCRSYDLPYVVDAAESLGASYRGRASGVWGDAAVFSFNGNKIMTTGGGGMLVTDDDELADRVRFRSTQAREPEPHYEHHELGFNFRLSNLLAAVGRGQLLRLPAMVARRRAVHERYRRALDGAPGIGFAPTAPWGEPNRWLTVLTVDPTEAGIGAAELVRALERADIEARPSWKPLHLQRLYQEIPVRGGAVAERSFLQGVCLPSGSTLDDGSVDRVAETVLSSLGCRVG